MKKTKNKMRNPSSWNKHDLHRHLQHALDVELWTIPLYLTALYSIKDITKIRHHEYPEAAKLIFSVVIQEMLHAELVCNVSNALGYPPVFKCPEYDESRGIPFIHPPQPLLPDELKGYHVKPQALNKESLQLFCAIEMPQPLKEIIWEKEKQYNSIAELYAAIKIGITSLWDSCYVGDSRNTRQKNTFKEYHNTHGKKHGFSIIINSADSALKAIEAIVEQGEGADNRHVPADFRPVAIIENEEFETEIYKTNLSHYQKFRILLHSHHKLPPVYEENITSEAEEANLKMKQVFINFWNLMESNFSTEGYEMEESFWHEMRVLGISIATVWEAGMCPDFNNIRS
jgi:hypothetical protein